MDLPLLRRVPRVFLLGITAVVAAGACSSGSSKATTAPTSTPSSPTHASGAPTTSAATTSTTPAGGTEQSPPGDIPDNQAFVAYTPAGAHYSVAFPEGWARTEEKGATLFTDKFNGVRLESRRAATAPTVASVQGKDVPKIPNATSVKVSTVSRQSGPAVLATYEVPSPPDPVTGKHFMLAVERYSFWHNGTEVILTLSSPTGSDNVDPWRKITDSLTWK